MSKVGNWVLIVVMLGLLSGITFGGPIETSLTLVADRLVDNQDGTGYWPDEPQFTGSIVVGLVCAYEVSGNAEYKTSAQLGGDYIMWSAEGNYYGDEAYALARLSEISADPLDNVWRTELSAFYQNVKTIAGTANYIAGFDTVDPSTAVFYLSYHTMAAFYVNAVDKNLWRQALISYLSEVSDDTAEYPVMAVGVAVMALGSTGPLDSTPVRTPPGGQLFWTGKTLADLPALLASRQVAEGEEFGGSFCWKLLAGSGCENPVGGACAGYTEDTIFAVLGLVTDAKYTSDYDAGILAAREILPIGVYTGGVVKEHIWLGGSVYYAYAGEMLQVLCGLSPAGDSNDDGDVDFLDLVSFSGYWLETGCEYPEWCGHADLNHDSIVNLIDFALFTDNWLFLTSL